MTTSLDLTRSFRQRISFDTDAGEIRDGAIRYLIMRPDALMGMFARLSPAARAEAIDALAASVAENGGKSVKAYRDNGAADPEALMQTIVATSADLGWGDWSFDRTDDTGFAVTVRNSPFADGIGSSDVPVCGAIRGILTAMGPLLTGGKDVTVTETDCHAVSGTGTCSFVVSC